MNNKLDPDQVREMRRNLSMTQTELGKALGLRGGDVGRTVRGWEQSQDHKSHKPITGPAALALTYLAQGALDETMKKIVPEFVVASDALSDKDSELVIHLWRPRFIAVVADPDIAQSMPDSIEVDAGIESLAVAMWIDDPDGFDVDDLLKRAASSFEIYTQDSFEAAEN